MRQASEQAEEEASKQASRQRREGASKQEQAKREGGGASKQEREGADARDPPLEFVPAVTKMCKSQNTPVLWDAVGLQAFGLSLLKVFSDDICFKAKHFKALPVRHPISFTLACADLLCHL
jgi:hypothetical protein